LQSQREPSRSDHKSPTSRSLALTISTLLEQQRRQDVTEMTGIARSGVSSRDFSSLPRHDSPSRMTPALFPVKATSSQPHKPAHGDRPTGSRDACQSRYTSHDAECTRSRAWGWRVRHSRVRVQGLRYSISRRPEESSRLGVSMCGLLTLCLEGRPSHSIGPRRFRCEN
jgi:hypothetical protein